MAETAKKRERIIDRSYSDKTGEFSLSVGDDVLLEGAAANIHPESAVALLNRAASNLIASVYTMALKAEGGTHEKALERVSEVWSALQDGSYKHRAAAGEGMSDEEEKEAIAKAAVELGYFENIEQATAKVEEVYNTFTERKNKDGTPKLKEDGSPVRVRSDYNTLKRDPDIRAAIAKASGNEDQKAKTKAIFGGK